MLFADSPMSKDFAVALGIEKSDFTDGRDSLPEMAKVAVLCKYLDDLRRETEEQQDIILSRFAAFYLPATIERALDVPPHNSPRAVTSDIIADMGLINGYLIMLVALQHIPYLTQYLNTGKRLAAVLAERLVDLSPRWNDSMRRRDSRSNQASNDGADYNHEAGNVVQLLGSLCTVYIKEKKDKVIPAPIRERLLPLLTDWARRYRNDFLGVVSLRLYQILTDPAFKPDVKKMRSRFKNWEVCALPTCNATQNLKACSRYCSADHQREHWTYNKGFVIVNHKQMCHKTEY
ncbi:hypothetical protein BDZ89DRAFT_1075893 [Hymenopellis radicata]|nr:hypothetical protein BDZ89DRAFT_1075893 [Hymenopellis radicata]